MGFAAGNERLISALTRMKSYLDYGAFTPDPGRGDGGAERPAGLRAEMRDLYSERRDVLIRGPARGRLGRAAPGRLDVRLGADPASASPISGSVEFSKLLLARAKVAVAPGIGFGEHGDGHVRIALVENTHRLRQALRNIRGFLPGRQRRRRPSAEPDAAAAA